MKRDPRTGSLWQVPTGLDDVADQPMTSKGDGTIIRQEPTELSSRDNRAGRSVSSAKSHWRRLPRGEELEPPVDAFPAIEYDGTIILSDQQESTSGDDKQHESTTNEASVRPASEPSSATAHPTPMTVTLHPSTPFRKIPTPSSSAPTAIHKLKSISVSVLERGPAPPPDLPKAYILSSNAALSHVSSLPRSQFLRLLPYRWKGHFGASLKTAVWREDMADLVLSLLRKRVVKWLLSRDGAISVPERRVSEMDLPGNLSALLWVVDPWEEPCGDGQVKGEGKLRSEPPLGAVVRMGGKPGGRDHEGSDERNRVDGDRIPVFNLPLLLGQESLGELQHGRAQHNYKKWSGWLGLEQGKLSMKLVGMLWGLTRYVGDGQVELREWAVR